MEYVIKVRMYRTGTVETKIQYYGTVHFDMLKFDGTEKSKDKNIFEN